MLPIGAFCSGLAMLNITSVPCLASEQQVTNSTPAFLASAIGLASASLSAASMMTASAPSRIAASNALLTFSGDPSVPTVLTDHPSILAPSWRIGPWTAQASTPQETKVIFLPLGMFLPTGLSWVICVGRVDASLTSFCAAPRSALDEPPPPPPGTAPGGAAPAAPRAAAAVVVAAAAGCDEQGRRQCDEHRDTPGHGPL